jgi:HSP20 family protein
MLLARRNNNSDLMSNFFDNFFDTDWMPFMNHTAPAVNVKETDKAYTMEVAVPGLRKDECTVNINDDGCLEIKIENKNEKKEENKKEHYLRREFSYGDYEQSYSLPEDVDQEHISAKVDNGVLEVELPKLAQTEEKKAGRRIEIA